MVERMNKTLCERLRIYCQQIEEWDSKLKEVIMGINSNINKITRKSPFYLVHGFEPRTRSLNEWNIIDSRISKNIEQERQDSNLRTEEKQKKTLDQKNKPDRSSRLKTGDLVMKEIKGVSPEKGKHFTPRFEGPFLIVKKLDKGCVTMYCFRSKKEIICNIDNLKKYFGQKPKGYLNVRTKYEMNSE